MVTRDGLWFVAAVALVPWALWCSRPGKRAFAAEWLAAAVGISAICFWSTYVIWITLIAVALVPATYMACAGILLRRLARTLPLALAAPAAWIAFETLRLVVEPPFGFGWLRLGHHAHAEPWLAGSARVFGTAGVGFALAALAGGICDLWRARGQGAPLARSRFALVCALAPLGVCVLLSFLTSAPATMPGPRVLLVQPAFPQARKMAHQSEEEMLAELFALTRRGVEEAARAGEPLDVVAWGETIFPRELGDPDLLSAYDAGVRSVPWTAWPLTRERLEGMAEYEQLIVGDYLFGRGRKRPILPPGASFVTGVEYYAVEDGALRRSNAIVAWDGRGERTGVGGKVHLVPGAEHLAGLERLAWVRDTAQELAGYIPDLVSYDRARVIPLVGREGRSWRVGTTVCFDNTFEDVYLEPLREGEIDFHLVASNEAWYVESWEYDQMMAMSHMVAIESGRSLVRATNSGITAVIGPDGRERARLEVLGRDRMVAGTLRAVVPVPARVGDQLPSPPYVATRRAWTVVWIAIGFVLAAFAGARAVTARR